ncbi:hypothetical protein [Demequina mangrovi]|uniref:Uncharacterized protein n=1 Tax=Demequina mangrovi TaxID=1043493 RepID=A0A1H6U1T9_9MICO|nr:hypothetical protein [Demequina mangrovi]SEI81912.1 hypothetical protein SAMN05421637_0096 [Demequina mangrovi]
MGGTAEDADVLDTAPGITEPVAPALVWHSDHVNESSLVPHAEAVRAAAEDRTHRRRLAVQLETTAALVATRRDELAELERVLAVERSDVRRLEELSPTRIWATLRGDAADRLAVERAEADAAALAVAGAQARLGRAVAEDSRLRREHDALRGADRAYTDALVRYEEAIVAAGGQDAAALTALAERLGVAEARQREIAEAVDALHATRAALDAALAELDSAGGWSTYDTFFGGGFVTDMIKHSRIDGATEAFREVNRALERLSVELADIGGSTIDGVDISQLLTVFDVVFDNIVSDWMVKERISEAQTRAKGLRRRLSQLADELGADAAKIAARVTELQRQREAILTTI